MGDRDQWEEGQSGLSGTTLPWWLTVKNLPAMQETWVRSLGQEDPLEKEMATCSSVLAWRIPGMGEPDGLPSMGSRRVGHDWSDLAAAAVINLNVNGLNSPIKRLRLVVWMKNQDQLYGVYKRLTLELRTHIGRK